MNSDEFKYNRLMTPGPVPMPQEVYHALAQPAIHHRAPEFLQIFADVLKQLKEVFQTEQPILMHASTGSGAMESAIVNTLSSGDEVLCVISGKFGQRWSEICKTYGLSVHELPVVWGEPVDPQDIVKALKTHPQIKAVLTQYCETSTATVHPIEKISKELKAFPNVMLMVDAITALGASPMPMDAWGLDVVVAGSQKAFMLPTGLSFIGLSKKAWLASQAAKLPKFYFDLQKELKANRSGQTHFSSPTALIRALHTVLPMFLGHNLQTQMARCERLSMATRSSAQILNFKVFSKAPSPSVTALTTPEGIDSEKLRDLIEKKYKVTLMGGQDHLKGKIIRIGHLGAIENNDVYATMKALGLGLKDLGLNISQEKLDNSLQVCNQILET